MGFSKLYKCPWCDHQDTIQSARVNGHWYRGLVSHCTIHNIHAITKRMTEARMVQLASQGRPSQRWIAERSPLCTVCNELLPTSMRNWQTEGRLLKHLVHMKKDELERHLIVFAMME